MGQRQPAAAPSKHWDKVSPVSPGDPSPLERGLHAVVATFYQYAQCRGGGEPSLDPPGFQRLLRRELGHQLTDTGHAGAVAATFALLDADGDGLLSFADYWDLVAWLCHVLRHRHYGATPPAPAPRREPGPAREVTPVSPERGDSDQ